MTVTAGSLFDRGSELSQIEAQIQDLNRGRGSILAVEGHPGVGKTALLSAATDAARSAGVRPIVARANEVEQGYAFALVRQLMNRAQRGVDATLWRSWLVGPAASARHILMSDVGEVSPLEAADADDPGFALLHGLYWLTVAMSEDQPTLFIIDDAHWADEPSLRFLNFLSARLDTAPIGLLVAARPGRVEVGRLFATPGARVSRPRSLGLPALTSWLRQDLGTPPSPDFALAVREATSGNPLLVRELIREIDLEGIAPDDAHVDRVALLAPDSVITATQMRLLGLPERALALANAVAVLEQTDLAGAAMLAGLTAVQASAAWSQLADVEILARDQPLRFQHPLMRTVVYREMSTEDRSVAHERAAHLLADRGAESESVAAHLLLTFSTDPWLVRMLQDAARRARALGSSEGAVTYLRRALAACPVGSSSRTEIKIALAEATAESDADAAVGLLRTVRETATEVTHRTEAAVAIARIQRMRGKAGSSIDLLLAAKSDLAPEDSQLADRIDTELLAAMSISCSARVRLRGWLADRPLPTVLHTAWDHLFLASRALDAALDGEPAPVVLALASRAIGRSQTHMDRPLFGYVMLLAGQAFLATDEFGTASAIFTDLVSDTVNPLQPSRHAVMLAYRASGHLRMGRLADAETDASRALELDNQSGSIRAMLPRVAAVLVSAAVEREDEPPMRYLTDDLDPDSTSYRHLVYSRAEFGMARGLYSAAADAFQKVGRLNHELGYQGATSAWRSNQALCLDAVGRSEEAWTLAEEELRIARHAGAPRAIGISLHASGRLVSGEQRSALLEEAVEVLSSTPLLLEPARALLDLAEDHRSNDRLALARTRLRTALDLAHDAASPRLIRQVTGALTRAGARPTSRRSTGSGALTPSERSICHHAASGLSNREIAQTLFVTEKTVEAHLRNSFRKLGIRSRRELPTTI